MSAKPKFCPECGETLGAKNVCEKCGYDGNSAVYKKSEAKQAASGSGSNNGLWNAVADYIPKVGKWAWALMIVHALITLITLVINVGTWNALFGGLVAFPAESYVWPVIQMGVAVVFALIYVLPSFSKKCAAQDYDFLLDDVIVLGTIRIPKMLLFGAIIEIFTDAWGGSILLFVAVMLIFFSPKAPFKWKV